MVVRYDATTILLFRRATRHRSGSAATSNSPVKKGCSQSWRRFFETRLAVGLNVFGPRGRLARAATAGCAPTGGSRRGFGPPPADGSKPVPDASGRTPNAVARCSDRSALAGV
jgi:hypothetical protein